MPKNLRLFGAAALLVACATSTPEPSGARVELVSGCPGGSAGTAGVSGSVGEAGSPAGGEGGATEGGHGGEATGGTAGAGEASGAAGLSGASGSAGDSAGSAGSSGSAGAPPCSTPAELTAPLTFSVLRAGLLDGSSGGNWEQARDVAFLPDGSMFVVGGTSATDFPVTQGAYDTTRDGGGSSAGSNGPMDWFVTRINAAGAVAWSTYVGGPNYDLAYAVEVDSTGVYVAGRCGSGFPVTTGALQTTFAGDSVGGLYGQQDGCVAKLALDGASLLWSTYVGDSGPAIVRDIAVDSSNRVHVAVERAYSSMASKVTTGAPQTTVRGTMDSFYLRLSATGSAVEFGTYLGGNETASYTDGNPSVRVLGDSAYVLTSEPATNYPTTSGALQPTGAGGYDMLLARFTGNALTWATYLGGSGNEQHDTHSLAVLPSGAAVVVAYTTSNNFPSGSAIVGGTDIGAAIISADGSSLVAGTTLGGSANDAPEGVSVDACGNVYVTGGTTSTNLPVTSGALVGTSNGARKGFYAVLSPDLQTRRYVSYDGITGQYANRSSALAPDGSWAIVGSVWQLNPFPSVGGYDSALTGTHGAFFQVLEEQ